MSALKPAAPAADKADARRRLLALLEERPRSSTEVRTAFSSRRAGTFTALLRELVAEGTVAVAERRCGYEGRFRFREYSLAAGPTRRGTHPRGVRA